MDTVRPATAEELAGALREAANANRAIRLGGGFSKDAMAGPVVRADVCLSTGGLSRVLRYEPKDLTISVEAGMPWAELSALLARNGQMIPLDPPYYERATVGGAVVSNSSGPRRRLFGTARDMVIGMTFATLEGKLVQSGGMVVKNVAGLDMGKLMIGSFGTLAAVTSVNFKVTPLPLERRTFAIQSRDPEGALEVRDALLRGVLQPSAIDLLNPAAADRVGLKNYCLIVEASGAPAVLERYNREFGDATALCGADASRLWAEIREFVPKFVEQYPRGAVLRFSSSLAGIRDIFRKHSEPVLARAGSGVTYVCFEEGGKARAEQGSVVEYAPAGKPGTEMWPQADTAFDVMKRIKALFDPKGLLNPGRLYGRL